jgi:signal transduction histidine kinase
VRASNRPPAVAAAPMTPAPAESAPFGPIEAVAIGGLGLAAVVKTVASIGLGGFLVPSVAYVALLGAVMLLPPAASGWRWVQLGALATLGVWSMVASANETLLMTASLLPVAALLHGQRTAVLAAALLVIATASISAASGEPATDQVQWIASVAGASLFLLAFSRLLVRERAAREALRREATLVRELTAAAERGRISADLHDGLGHHLSAALIQLEAVRALGAAAPPDRTGALLDAARALIVGAMADVRQTMSATRRGEVDRPLFDALGDLVRANCDAGIPTRLVERGGPVDPIPPAVAYAVWRVVQEALSNVRRHAGAAAATVTVTASPHALSVEVLDDGDGGGPIPEGMGLRGMRERVEAIGGSLAVARTPGEGFRVAATVPR